MSDENLIQRYEARLREMERLDRDYYGRRDPSPAERAAYYRRKQRAEEMRTRFYAELHERQSGKRLLWRAKGGREVVTHSLAVH